MLLPQSMITLFVAVTLYLMPVTLPHPSDAMSGGCGVMCAMSCNQSAGNNILYRMCYNACTASCENPGR